MNIRNHHVEIECSLKDIYDVSQVLVHSLIFFRTHGKFNYKHEGSYSIGTLGYERITCDQIDFTYIRCSSANLVSRIDSKIQEFVDRFTDNSQCGTLSLEFYTRKPSRWPFNDTRIVWELWTIKIVIVPSGVLGLAMIPIAEHIHITSNQQQRLADSSTRLTDTLSQKLLDIIRIVNSDKCSIPQMPLQPNLDSVFDTSYSEVQPYLYNLSYKINETSTGTTPSNAGLVGKYGDGVVTDSSTPSSLKRFLLGTLEL